MDLTEPKLCSFFRVHLLLEVIEFLVELRYEALLIAAVTEHTVQATTPIVHIVVLAEGHTVIGTRSDALYLDIVLLEEINTLRLEI